MVILDFPDEIKKAIQIYEPYMESHNGSLEGAPPEVTEAYKKCYEWSWGMGQ